jgi:hypothetical protein
MVVLGLLKIIANDLSAPVEGGCRFVFLFIDDVTKIETVRF